MLEASPGFILASHGRRIVRDDLKRFLFEHVESYEELELIVLLRRQRERDWTAEAAASELGLSTSACRSGLEALEERGLIVKSALAGAFRYGPWSLEAAARLAQLDELHRNQRLAVVMLMSVNAIERLRLATLHRFADTLRLRDRNS